MIKKRERKLERESDAARGGLSFLPYLACVARFSHIPATVTAAAAHKGRVATQQDVKDDPQAPQVTALVIVGGLLTEGLHHLRGHVLC